MAADLEAEDRALAQTIVPLLLKQAGLRCLDGDEEVVVASYPGLMRQIRTVRDFVARAAVVSVNDGEA